MFLAKFLINSEQQADLTSPETFQLEMPLWNNYGVHAHFISGCSSRLNDPWGSLRENIQYMQQAAAIRANGGPYEAEIPPISKNLGF